MQPWIGVGAPGWYSASGGVVVVVGQAGGKSYGVRGKMIARTRGK